jgi:preprotein translocase subunit SecA
MSFISKLFPDESTKTIKKLAPIVDQVFAFEDELKSLSDEELKTRSLLLKDRVMKELEGYSGLSLKEKEYQVLESVLPEAFALVRESGQSMIP